MILSITPAPALDATTHLDVLELGESQRVDAPVMRAGGKGLNVARVLASRGFMVRSMSTRGGASGDRLAADLEATSVETRWLPVNAPTRTSSAWVEASGRTTVLNERAGALSPAEWDEWFALLDSYLEGVTAATVSGSWPQETTPEQVAKTVQILKHAGVYTVVDTSGPLLMAAARAGADLLKPNLEELLAATGAATAQEGLETLFVAGAGSVLLSRGEEGMSHHTAQDVAGLHARLDAVLVGNPTGAGDAGVAGWLSVVAELASASATTSSTDAGTRPTPETIGPLSPEARTKALTTAVAWSASAVQAPLAGELGPDVDSFMGRVSLSPHPSL